MKQISTLFDALRNEKFAIAVQDEYGIKYYGYEGQGKEWAQWANSVESKSLGDSQIPAGIIQGPFKTVTDTDIKSLITTFGYGESSASNFVKSKAYRHAGLTRVKSESRVPAVVDTPINYFTAYQYSAAVSYKCLHVRSSIKEGSFLHEARTNNYAFNFDKWMYNAVPDSEQNKSLRQRVDTTVGRSSERRIGMRLKSAIISNGIERTKMGVTELEIKSLENGISVKGIGDSIGSGLRIARRAGRAATANFDPKAWDGDGDGIVQEGTPFQRPAIPGVNDRATGGDVDVSAAMRAWIKNTPLRSTSSSPRPPSGRRMTTAPGTPPARRVMTTAPGTPPKRRMMTTAPGTPPKRTVMTNTSGPKPPPPRKPGGKPRIEKPEISPPRPPSQSGSVSRRVSEARTQRQVEGFASRSGKAVVRRRPGVDKMKDTDGKFHESLDDKQKEIVKENLKKRYEQLQEWVKAIQDDTGMGTWWSTFVNQKGRGIKKLDADGNPVNKDSRIAGEALSSYIRLSDKIGKEIDNEINVAESAKSALTPGVDDKEIKALDYQIKKLQAEKLQYTSTAEDLMVFDSMTEEDDWSLVEHLSTTSRRAAIGKTHTAGVSSKPKKGEESPFVSPFDNPKTQPLLDINAESSYFSGFEEAQAGKKRALIGAKKSGKLKAFADRVFDNAEEARRKRELRRQKRGTVRGLGESRPDAPGAKERARRKLARTARRIKRKFKGGPSESDVNASIDKTKAANPTIFGTGKGGVPQVNEKGIQRLAILFRGKDDPRALELLQEQKGQNAGKELGNVWTTQGYNALPTPITEADAEYLAGQGWKVIQRGHGTPPPPANNEAGALGWIQDYIEDPERFITGEGGAVYGPGEYWSRPGTGWDGYLAYNQGTLALISPEARVLKISEAAQLQSEHGKVWGQIGKALSGIGGGTQGAEDLDPQDLVKELKAAISKALADGDPIWSTEAGQLASNFFKYMETAPPAMRQELWAAIKYMQSITAKDEHYAAMIYGYDGVDHEGSSPIVWFNRGALAIVDEAMSGDRMKEIYATQKAS